jgi:hypothetical protein
MENRFQGFTRDFEGATSSFTIFRTHAPVTDSSSEEAMASCVLESGHVRYDALIFHTRAGSGKAG